MYIQLDCETGRTSAHLEFKTHPEALQLSWSDLDVDLFHIPAVPLMSHLVTIA